MRREELMCAQTIFTGKIPIIGDGVNEEIDFFFTNKETISEAKKKWTADTSDPIADLKRWHETVQKTGFVNCDICVMGTGVANAFVGNAKVQKVLDVKNYNLAVIQPRQLPNGTTYLGTIHELGLDIYKLQRMVFGRLDKPGSTRGQAACTFGQSGTVKHKQ